MLEFHYSANTHSLAASPERPNDDAPYFGKCFAVRIVADKAATLFV